MNSRSYSARRITTRSLDGGDSGQKRKREREEKEIEKDSGPVLCLCINPYYASPFSVVQGSLFPCCHCELKFATISIRRFIFSISWNDFVTGIVRNTLCIK